MTCNVIQIAAVVLNLLFASGVVDLKVIDDSGHTGEQRLGHMLLHVDILTTASGLWDDTTHGEDKDFNGLQYIKHIEEDVHLAHIQRIVAVQRFMVSLVVVRVHEEGNVQSQLSIEPGGLAHGHVSVAVHCVDESAQEGCPAQGVVPEERVQAGKQSLKTENPGTKHNPRVTDFTVGVNETLADHAGWVDMMLPKVMHSAANHRGGG